MYVLDFLIDDGSATPKGPLLGLLAVYSLGSRFPTGICDFACPIQLYQVFGQLLGIFTQEHLLSLSRLFCLL